MIFYIADLHLGDQTIFDKCKRPFKSLKVMEQTIVQNWNNLITDEDEIYILGDIGSENSDEYLKVFKILKGKKHLIVGNHDHSLLSKIVSSEIFSSISFINLIDDSGRKVCVCHYPLMDWMEFNRGGILVYGHIHNKTDKNGIAYKQIKDFYKDKPAYNCGVDVTGFKPVTLDQMIELKEKNKYEAYIN